MPSDPRNVVSFESIHAAYATFIPDGTSIISDSTQVDGAAVTMIGQAVSLSAGSTVQLTNDGDAVTGKLILVENDLKCNVQFEGFMRLPGGLAAALTVGKKIVGATGAAAARGFIREVNTATAAELGRMAARIIDATDPTNVIVNY